MRHKDVVGLDVAVYQEAIVQELQALKHLPRVVRGGSEHNFRRAVAIDKITQRLFGEP
jgi:hypothetical protein